MTSAVRDRFEPVLGSARGAAWRFSGRERRVELGAVSVCVLRPGDIDPTGRRFDPAGPAMEPIRIELYARTGASRGIGAPRPGWGMLQWAGGPGYAAAELRLGADSHLRMDMSGLLDDRECEQLRTLCEALRA